MIKSILFWAAKVPVLILLSLVAYLIAPFIACFIVMADETETTGHPSMLPGQPREFLIPLFRIWQSQDAPVDEWWWAGYEKDSWRRHFTQDDYDNSAILRWACRVAWLWRNPAYGWGEVFGFDGRGLKILASKGSEDDWYSGKSSVSYWTGVNESGEKAFYFQARLYYFKNRCLDILAGYKFFSDPATKYVAMRFTPFRKYPK